MRFVVVAAIAAVSVGGISRAQSVSYVYDDLGRLQQVIDETGDSATYNYDAVGNILSIERGLPECSGDPPAVTAVRASDCIVGGTCLLAVEGTSLLGAGVAATDPKILISDCRAECTAINCLVSASPSAVPGSVTFRITTAFGTAEGAVSLLEAPSVGSAGASGLWHFAGSRGDVVTLTMTRIANQPNGSSTLDPYLELHDSRGFVLATDDDGGSAIPPGPGKNARILNVTLPATDTYQVLARGSGGTSGPYVLEISPPTLLLVPGPTTATEPEQPTFVFSGAITAIAERDTHSFSASNHAVITIEVNRIADAPDGSGSLDPTLELRDSRGFFIRGDDDGGVNDPPGPGRNAIIKNLTLRATDTYAVIVSGKGETVGPYEVRVFIRE